MTRVPTPWRVARWSGKESAIHGTLDGKTAHVTGYALNEDAARIVACVNACDAAGLTNEQLNGGILLSLSQEQAA